MVTPTRGSLPAERQRRTVAKPRVARHEQPWVSGRSSSNPNGVVARLGREENARRNADLGCDERRRWSPRTPQPRWGCSVVPALPQGKRSFLALTLGFATG